MREQYYSNLGDALAAMGTMPRRKPAADFGYGAVDQGSYTYSEPYGPAAPGTEADVAAAYAPDANLPSSLTTSAFPGGSAGPIAPIPYATPTYLPASMTPDIPQVQPMGPSDVTPAAAPAAAMSPMVIVLALVGIAVLWSILSSKEA